MYEKLEQCPVCKNTHFTNNIIATDHSVSGESFALVQCSKCSLVFTNPRPDQASLPDYYKSDQYISHTDKGNSLVNIIYKLVRNITLRKKHKLIQGYLNKGKLLDYGCGTGYFVSYCQNRGWETLGYEPDQDARSQAEQKGIKLIDDLDEMAGKVDIITAWHVVEHIGELRKTLKSLKSKLEKGGFMFIAVPNLGSYDAKHYQEFWAAYDVPRHLYHFTQESFGKLIAKLKLQHIDTLPMKFDSYYVPILSAES
ncbi:MAG: class I SAM-dependent methyltransferase [Bacteroidota bacterium]